MYLPAYHVVVAAHYAGASSQAVARWHSLSGNLQPALGSRQAGSPLSYLELVEVAFVVTFRNLGVSLQRIRAARPYAATTFNVEFPFAELDWQNHGASLLLDYANVDPADGEAIEERAIIADRNGQMGWSTLIQERFLQFDYENFDFVVGWYPVGRESHVKIDPRIAFGAPTVEGLPTWIAKGRWQASETPEEIAEDFGVTVESVRSALAFEGVDVEAA